MIKKIAKILTSSKSVFIFSLCYLILAFITFTFITCRSTLATYIAYAVSVYGLIIIICTLINYKQIKINKIFIILILFIISFFASSLFAYKYGISENIKGLIWLTLEIIVLFIISPKNLKDKYLHYFLYVFIYINLFYAVVGIIMAMFGYMYYPSNLNNSDLVPGGIAHGRLYGLYADPNYGAISSCLAILSTIYICFKNKQKAEII